MPLIIGEVDARIEVVAPREEVTVASQNRRLAAAEAARARELAAQRMERERRIDLRERDLPGGR